MPSLRPLIRRAFAHLSQRRRAQKFAAELHPSDHPDLAEIGDLDGGGYVLPASLLGPDSICYLAGAGEDISFDLGVIARFGCTVHTIDPVPRAAAHVAEAAAYEPRLIFHPVALWSRDEILTFHAPAKKGQVSQSAVNLNQTPADFTAPARSLTSLMADLGHDHLDVLKISIAGAEYEVLDHLISRDIAVRVLCVEYSPPVPLRRASQSVRSLEHAGYTLVAASMRPWTWKLTFVRPKGGDPPPASPRVPPDHRSARRRSGYSGATRTVSDV
jgi:FkbM family methyltransferase